MIIRIPALMPGNLTVYERRRLAICLRDALAELLPAATLEWTTGDDIDVGYATEQERKQAEQALQLALDRALKRFYEWQDRVHRTGVEDLENDEYVRAHRVARPGTAADDPFIQRLKRIYWWAGLLGDSDDPPRSCDDA
jgi:hypothetical protein